MKAPNELAKPNGWLLPNVTDRGDWVYLDTCSVRQDDWGVVALMNVEGKPSRVYLPVANLNAILLGPGVTISSRALQTCTQSGSCVITVGAGGTRTYTYTPASRGNPEMLRTQASITSDPARRLEAARRLYFRRFPDMNLPENLSLDQLRGMEGKRVQTLYRRLAEQHAVRRFKRTYDPHDFTATDPVNQALSAANACLYGIATAVTVAVGCSPGLGIIHTGTQASFVHDIADVHKAATTVPLAFSLHSDPTPAATARRRLRDSWSLLRMTRALVDTLHVAMGLPLRGGGEQPMVGLWDGEETQPGGTNYGDWPQTT